MNRLALPILCLALLALGGFSRVAHAQLLTYDDFPGELQTVLDERIDVLDTEGGICIAGRVVFSDGAPIAGGEDLVVNFKKVGIIAPVVYEDGWFVFSRTYPATYAGPGGEIVGRALGYDGLTSSTIVLDGEMTYTPTYTMQKVLPENESSISGVVVDGRGSLVNGAEVQAGFSLPYSGFSGGTPRETIITGPDGAFSFGGLSQDEHYLTARLTDYSSATGSISPPIGDTATWDPVLYPRRRIIINYVYQSDGTQQFSGPGLEEGRIDWPIGGGSMDFEDGGLEYYEPSDLRDLELYQQEDTLQFDIVYVNGSNGYYDAGAVDFDSVTEAASSGYTTSFNDIMVDHVYVVRTYNEGHYAKLIVKTNEPSFLPVVPGDMDPADFATYGLTIDVSASDGFGKLFVQLLANGEFVAGPVNSLPYLWKLVEPNEVNYTTDLVFEYTDQDVLDAGLDEGEIRLARSSDDGSLWGFLDATHDTDLNTFTLTGQETLGHYIITKDEPFGDGWTLF